MRDAFEVAAKATFCQQPSRDINVASPAFQQRPCHHFSMISSPLHILSHPLTSSQPPSRQSILSLRPPASLRANTTSTRRSTTKRTAEPEECFLSSFRSSPFLAGPKTRFWPMVLQKRRVPETASLPWQNQKCSETENPLGPWVFFFLSTHHSSPPDLGRHAITVPCFDIRLGLQKNGPLAAPPWAGCFFVGFMKLESSKKNMFGLFGRPGDF